MTEVMYDKILGRVRESRNEGGSGTNNYNSSTNKPQINSVELIGNKSAPELGLATSSQGSKADTAVQQVTVGTTTTGAAGTNASVANSGTATNPVLDFTIPRGVDGADAVNPFKGWWPDLATLKAAITATPGDYAYVIPAVPTDPVPIYEYDSTATTDNYWSDSGRTFNPANNQEFASGENLNETYIDDTHLVNPKSGALAKAEDVKSIVGDAVADLDVNDDKGNTLVRFSNGNIATKYFDSSKTPQESADDITQDFSITDENGNAIVVFQNGHILTKHFDSSIIEKNFLKGKKVSILGDSISTAPNNNAVEFTVLSSDITQGRTLQGYPTYYDIGTTIGDITVTSEMIGVLTSFHPISGDVGKTIGKVLNYNSLENSGVSSYQDTWWYKLVNALEMQILQNVSWSGASISSHEGNSNNYKTSYAWHDAQINKLATRDDNGNVITPDIVIIYRGTNDMSHTPYASITDFGADATSIPNTDYDNSSYDFKVAYCLTIKKIREAYPQAKIFICTLNVFKRVNYSHFPTNNGINTLPEYNNAIREVANMMGCGIIEFDKDGVTFENCYPTYISDSSTIPTHPNPTGHTIMAEKAIKDIKNY